MGQPGAEERAGDSAGRGEGAAPEGCDAGQSKKHGEAARTREAQTCGVSRMAPPAGRITHIEDGLPGAGINALIGILHLTDAGAGGNMKLLGAGIENISFLG